MKRRTLKWEVLDPKDMTTTHINNCILHLVKRLNISSVSEDDVLRYSYVIWEFNKELESRGEPKLNVDYINWVYCAEFDWLPTDYTFLDIDQEPTS